MVRRDASVQQSQNGRTYLPRAQGLAQTERVGSRPMHTHGVANNSNISANMSATSDLPSRGSESRMGEPERLESQTDASDTRTRVQGIANDSRRSGNTSDTVRTPQDNWTKSKLPARSPKIVPREATEAREPRGCNRRTHARAEHLSRRENDHKNNGRRQKTEK